jgi:aminopeptidase N
MRRTKYPRVDGNSRPLRGARCAAGLGTLALCVLAAAGCGTPPKPSAAAAFPEPSQPASVPMATDPGNWPDIHSHADPRAFVTRHFTLDLDVDFTARGLRGTVVLELERLDDAARELVLDTRDLHIGRVETGTAAGDDWRKARFELGPRHAVLGSPLRIAMPAAATRVRIGYSTSPEASGLQWLEPRQTLGRQAPFVYSQAQSLHARSFVPLQDTPWIRATFDATLRVPEGLVAVMAAESDAGNRRGAREFRFRMPQPIPSYLLALAVGDLEFQETGPRTGVWAEPGHLEPAAREFADADAMLRQSEALWGPYRWGRYDVLVLPPSFPYGGMENPRLTFMTPTLIAGDRSLVGVLAHELAHSWSGNLVTNATWRDGWLNEGFTTYFERRIMEAMYGTERAAMEWGVGMQDLQRSLGELGPDEQWRSALAPDLAAYTLEDGSSVAYEKGALFLLQLENRYGREALDRFLQGWFERHAFTSVTTPQFVAELKAGLMARYPGRVDDAFLQRWIDAPGLPDDAVRVQSPAFARVAASRAAWEAGTLGTADLPGEGWTVQEWLEFLNGPEGPQPVSRLAELDARFGLTGTGNAEVAHAWYRVAIRSGYQAALPAVDEYLLRIGRLKLIRPLYRDLMGSEEGAARARSVYAIARPGYHPVVQRALDQVVK